MEPPDPDERARPDRRQRQWSRPDEADDPAGPAEADPADPPGPDDLPEPEQADRPEPSDVPEPGDDTPEPGAPPTRRPAEWAGRNQPRLDRIGSLLPDRAAEDDPERWGDRSDESDARYLRDVPPHHGN